MELEVGDRTVRISSPGRVYFPARGETKLDLNSYDVVVLDRDLPGIHGDALCQMITERDGRVMVLMLTAASGPGERVSGLGLGADDYLAKPFHFPELVARIRSLARRQPSARGRILRVAGIELDPLRRTVTLTGGSFSCRSRSSRSSKRSCSPPRRSSAPRTCSNRSGTSRPIRSPTPSR